MRELFTVVVVCAVITVAPVVALLGVTQIAMVQKAKADPGSHSTVAEADLYVKKKPHPLQKEYPELFATEGIIVAFGADWCSACKRQGRELRGPAARYNILKVDVQDEAGKPTKWGRLMETLELGKTIPVVIVVSKGEVVKVFYGFTPWAEIAPHAKKAKKNDSDDVDGVDIGPLHIDWNDGVRIDWGRDES